MLTPKDDPASDKRLTDESRPAVRRSLWSHVTFVFSLASSLVFGVVMHILDWITDAETIRLYLVSEDYKFASILLAFLLLYIIVSACYGIRYISSRSIVYGALWRRHQAVRAAVVILHCLGLGSVALNLDLAATKLRVRLGKKDERAEEHLSIKVRHCTAMSLIHAFVESFPQLLLQTVFIFIKETYRTNVQCFPTSLGSKGNATLWRVKTNGSVEDTNDACICSDSKVSTTCIWPLEFVFVVSIVMSLSSLSLNTVRHGPVAFMEEEANRHPESLPVRPSFLVKTGLYICGLLAGLLGLFGFVFLETAWSFMTTPYFLGLLPLVLLQITQPNWLAFMWHRIRKTETVSIGSVVHHRGVWWRFFLLLSPFAYVIVTAPISVFLMFKYLPQLSDLVGDYRPLIVFSDVNVSVATNCAFYPHGMEDPKRWSFAVADVYPNCRKDESLEFVVTNGTNEKMLELGNGLLMAPGDLLHCLVRCGAIFFGAIFALVQMAIFRTEAGFPSRPAICLFIFGLLGILNELLLMYNQNYEDSEITLAFAVASLFYFILVIVFAVTPICLLCRKFFRCCCRVCCDQ